MRDHLRLDRRPGAVGGDAPRAGAAKRTKGRLNDMLKLLVFLALYLLLMLVILPRLGVPT